MIYWEIISLEWIFLSRYSISNLGAPVWVKSYVVADQRWQQTGK